MVGRFQTEAGLRDCVAAGIADAAEVLGLPPVLCVKREALLSPTTRSRRLRAVRRVDVLAIHSDGSYSLIEAKNNATTSEIAQGVGQLLLYRTDLLAMYPGAKVHLVLATNQLDVQVRTLIQQAKVGVHMLIVADDKFAAVRCG